MFVGAVEALLVLFISNEDSELTERVKQHTVVARKQIKNAHTALDDCAHHNQWLDVIASWLRVTEGPVDQADTCKRSESISEGASHPARYCSHHSTNDHLMSYQGSGGCRPGAGPRALQPCAPQIHCNTSGETVQSQAPVSSVNT